MRLKDLLNTINSYQTIRLREERGDYIQLTWENVSNCENYKVINVEADDNTLVITIGGKI